MNQHHKLIMIPNKGSTLAKRMRTIYMIGRSGMRARFAQHIKQRGNQIYKWWPCLATIEMGIPEGGITNIVMTGDPIEPWFVFSKDELMDKFKPRHLDDFKNTLDD